MFLLAKAIGVVLTPPGIILLLALVGGLLQLRWRRTGIALIAASLLALFVFSAPSVGYWLIDTLEDAAKPLTTADAALRTRADAIVVLGGGRYAVAPEYGSSDTVSTLTLERLRYAAHLHRQTRLPILVSGGAPYGESVPEAELMRQTLAQDFQVQARWTESRSRNTLENASYSQAILKPAGIKRVLLVTHASHMRRAMWSFDRAGLSAIAAPTAFTTRRTHQIELLPSAPALLLSSRAMQEHLGYWWYRMYY